MSVNPANLAYFGAAPVAGGSTVLAFGGSSMQELAYIGTAACIGDNSATAFFINFVDGTNALGFTPTAVVAFRSGGNATNTVAVLSTNAISNTQCTVNFSAAPGTNATATVAVFVLK